MTEVETLEKEALALLLRSKTALVRLTDAEVHSVLAFLESIGFKHYVSAGDPVAPSGQIDPPPFVPSVAASAVPSPGSSGTTPIEPPPAPPAAPPAPVVAPAP